MAPLGAVCGDVARVTRRARTWVTHLSKQGMTPAPVWPVHCPDCGVAPHTPGAHSLPSGWREKSSLVKSLEVNIIPFPSGITFLQRSGGCCSNIAKESLFLCFLHFIIFLLIVAGWLWRNKYPSKITRVSHIQNAIPQNVLQDIGRLQASPGKKRAYFTNWR